MQPSERAFELIRNFEGLRLRAYKATPKERHYTIGYGHCGEDVTKNQLITQKQAEVLMRQDVEQYSYKLAQFAPNLNQREFDALISTIYNIGWYKFRYSMLGITAKSIHKEYKPIDVARRMILYVKAAGVTLIGLQIRRCKEANYFLGYDCFTLENGTIYEDSTIAWKE